MAKDQNKKPTKEQIEEALELLHKGARIVPPEHNAKDHYVPFKKKLYPVKYVAALALAKNHDDKDAKEQAKGFNSDRAQRCLQQYGYLITGPDTFFLTIPKNGDFSSDEPDFVNKNDLSRDNGYETLDAYATIHQKEIRWKNSGGKREQTFQLLGRLAFQEFGDKISKMSEDEKNDFPTYRERRDKQVEKGFNYGDREREVLSPNPNPHKLSIHYQGPFSNIPFCQECLNRWGDDGDEFVLIYRKKGGSPENKADHENDVDPNDTISGSCKKYANILEASKNVIFRGAPGTGKTYLAKQIASYVVSGGSTCNYDKLDPDQQQQIGFVQFHPNYDYSDFVEGLRPLIDENSGAVGFELRDGIFKSFVERAIKDQPQSRGIEEAIEEYLRKATENKIKLNLKKGSQFSIDRCDEKNIYVSNPSNTKTSELRLKIDRIYRMLISEEDFEKLDDLRKFFHKKFKEQQNSYELSIYREIRKSLKDKKQKSSSNKKYVFIIDEINRGEISKIFGELFYSIDPGYRGKKGEISTQFANMHEIADEKFYIPENVYIIGTMNDIDRSVDAFDFAMRRRFRFIELKAKDCASMLDGLKNNKNEAIERMNSLNDTISETEGLNDNYQIGPAYFLKLNEMDFDELWNDFLEPLLGEYVRGMADEENLLQKFKEAYDSPETGKDDQA